MSKGYLHQLVEIRRLQKMEGWKIFCAAFGQEIERMEDEIFSTETGPSETMALKLARMKLKEAEPEKLAERLIRIADKNLEKRGNHGAKI